MDNQNKATEEQNPLSALLSDPEVMATLSGIAMSLKEQMPKSDDPPHEQSTSAEPKDQPKPPFDPEIMKKLPEVMAVLSPMLQGNGSEKKSHDKKTALLNALRPYLSAGRCEAIDYITRLEKLGDAVKNIRL